MADKNVKKLQRQAYPECPTRGKKNHPVEKCWRGAGAHLRPKRTSPDDKTDDTSGDEKASKNSSNSETTTSGQSTSRKTDSKN